MSCLSVSTGAPRLESIDLKRYTRSTSVTIVFTNCIDKFRPRIKPSYCRVSKENVSFSFDVLEHHFIPLRPERETLESTGLKIVWYRKNKHTKDSFWSELGDLGAQNRLGVREVDTNKQQHSFRLRLPKHYCYRKKKFVGFCILGFVSFNLVFLYFRFLLV